MKHLRWTGVRTADWDDRMAFWRAFDIPADTLEDFAAIGLSWKGSGLMANQDLASQPGILTKVAAMIGLCLQWESFSGTRWGKVGRSCRFLVRSLAVGLDGLWAVTMSDENVGGYHLKGFSRCDTTLRQFIVSAALTPFPAESMLEAIFLDDRLLRFADDWRRRADEELEYLCGLPSSVWFRLAEVGETDSLQLKRRTLHGAFATAGYLYMDALHQLKTYPLRLTQGDIDAELTTLANSAYDPGWDPTTKQVWELLGLNYSRDLLVRALKSLKDIPGTTNLVKRGHASGAVLLKFHDQYCEASLRARVAIHQAKDCFHPSAFEQEQDKLRSRVERLKKRQRVGIGGRQVFERLRPGSA